MSKWIIVADWASAKFFEVRSGGRTKRAHFLTEITHPRGKMKAIDINSDRPGRVFGASNARSSLDPAQDTHDHESLVFAKSLEGLLSQLQSQLLFDSFVMIAPPRFLGVIRKIFKKSLARFMEKTMPLELSELTLEQIKTKLKKLGLFENETQVLSLENPTNRHRKLSRKLGHDSQSRFKQLRSKKSA